jgi:ribosomal protein S18 acetylase RimI-like enzyme
MHKAEGVLFRDVLLRAAETCEVRALGIPEKRLSEQAERTLRTPMDTLRKTLAVLGKSVGPPWGKDQKDAALAALIALRSAEGRLPIRGEFERSPMMAAFTVRKATDDDVPSIVDCLREAFEPYRDDYTAAAFADTVPPPAMLTERLSAMCLFVAVSDHDEIVGTVGYRLDGKEEGHLRGMAVRPDQQGSGVAQRLLDAVEEDLRRLGCARITLDTTAPLHRAVSFYERNGFRASGRVSDFHGMPLFEFVKPLESRR